MIFIPALGGYGINVPSRPELPSRMSSVPLGSTASREPIGISTPVRAGLKSLDMRGHEKPSMSIQGRIEPVTMASIYKLRSKKLTRYEYARAVAARALQLALGAPPLIDIEELGLRDPVEIAREEVKRGVVPIIIRRRYASGEEELIPLSEAVIEQN
ncbi:MAG TPA: DNA-directed RNA polymerase subunit K [Sulfolobales archaeon]|nr:DNA-directed RNA polymerase subunit K [Sulfolobales archaeon]